MATFYTTFSFHHKDHDMMIMITASTWILILHINDSKFNTEDTLHIYAQYVPGYVEGIIGPQVFLNKNFRVLHFLGEYVYLPDYIIIPHSLLAYDICQQPLTHFLLISWTSIGLFRICNHSANLSSYDLNGHVYVRLSTDTG